jgi:imidazolonepropionase-like amidohydrolase
MGFGERTGQIKLGMDGDVTVLDGDPAKDIREFAHVALAVRQGQVIYQSKPPGDKR